MRKFWFASVILMLLSAVLAQATPSKKTVSVYRPGFIDTEAGSLALQTEGDGNRVSNRQPQDAILAEIQKRDPGRVVIFDTFVPARDLRAFVEQIRANTPGAEVIILVKKGDNGYRHFRHEHVIVETVNFEEESYLGKALALQGKTHTYGTGILDEGLQKEPTLRGKHLKEYWAVKKCSKKEYNAIKNGGKPAVDMRVDSGEKFLVKAHSQYDVILQNAEIFAFENLRVAVVSVITGVGTFGPRALKEKNVDLVVMHTKSVAILDGTNQFSLRAVAGKVNAGALARDIGKFFGGNGGGTSEAAGFTAKVDKRELVRFFKNKYSPSKWTMVADPLFDAAIVGSWSAALFSDKPTDQYYDQLLSAESRESYSAGRKRLEKAKLLARYYRPHLQGTIWLASQMLHFLGANSHYGLVGVFLAQSVMRHIQTGLCAASAADSLLRTGSIETMDVVALGTGAVATAMTSLSPSYVKTAQDFLSLLHLNSAGRQMGLSQTETLAAVAVTAAVASLTPVSYMALAILPGYWATKTLATRLIGAEPVKSPIP